MQFAHPEQLRWLIAAPLMLLAYIGYLLWKRKIRAQLGHSGHIAMMTGAHSVRRAHVRAACWIVSAALLAIAMAQPQWGQSDRVIKRTGVDVVFALDLSRSMLAQDNPPNRLRAAKDEVEATLSMLNGDRVGLVVFTAISFAQSPLTTDYGAVRFYLSSSCPIRCRSAAPRSAALCRTASICSPASAARPTTPSASRRSSRRARRSPR